LWNDRHHRSWFLLIAATILGYTLRAEGHVGLGVGLATLAIVYLKGRLIILDFMELRHAPRLWRLLVEGWLLLISVIVFAIYGTGMPAP
jgi:hypothetical protein